MNEDYKLREDDVVIDLMELCKEFKRKWMFIAISAVLCAGLAFGFNSFRSRNVNFSSVSVLRINQNHVVDIERDLQDAELPKRLGSPDATIKAVRLKNNDVQITTTDANAEAAQALNVKVIDMIKLRAEELAGLERDQKRQELDKRFDAFKDKMIQAGSPEALGNFLNSYYRDVAYLENLPKNRAVIISTATQATQPASRAKKMLAVGFVLGIFFSMSFIGAKFILNPKLRKEREVPVVLSLPCLAGVEAAKGLTEEFYLLRSNLSHLALKEGVNSFMVTSAKAGEGKSGIAFNLAQAFAKAQKRVLLVDCNMIHPTVADSFTSKPCELWTGRANNLEQCITESELAGLDFVAIGKQDGSNSGTFLDGSLNDVIKALEAKYDYVFLDAASVSTSTDTLDLCQVAGGTLLVVKKDAKLDDIREAKKRLTQVGANILGVVLNKC